MTLTSEKYSMSILEDSCAKVIATGSLAEQEQALAALKTMTFTDEDTAVVMHDLEQKLAVAILKSRRPSKGPKP